MQCWASAAKSEMAGFKRKRTKGMEPLHIGVYSKDVVSFNPLLEEMSRTSIPEPTARRYVGKTCAESLD